MAQKEGAGGGQKPQESNTKAPGIRQVPHGLDHSSHPAIGSSKIQFDLNSAELRPESRVTLEHLARVLKEDDLADDKILVEGHTDSSGTPEFNAVLSERRALAVGRYLTEFLGLRRERFSYIGKAATDPIDPDNPRAAENRRVVLVDLTR